MDDIFLMNLKDIQPSQLYISKKKLANLEKEIEKKQQEEQLKQKPKRKKEWFEKFRWFFTSDNMLVIAGRDATTNEIVVKKHTDKHDLIFHTEMAGSPFGVFKTEGKKPSIAIIKEWIKDVI